MRIIWAIIGGIVGFVFGSVAAITLAYALMSAMGVSESQSGPAKTDSFDWGPLGGLLGLGLGIWLALTLTRRRT
jgi:hypothetical protein